MRPFVLDVGRREALAPGPEGLTRWSIAAASAVALEGLGPAPAWLARQGSAVLGGTATGLVRSEWAPWEPRVLLPWTSPWGSTAMSPDGRWLLTGHTTGALSAVDLAAERAPRVLTAPLPFDERHRGHALAAGSDEVERSEAFVSGLAFHPSGQLVAVALTSQGGGELRLHRFDGGRLVAGGRTLQDPPGDGYSEQGLADAEVSLAFSPDGASLGVYTASQWNTGAWQGTVACFEVSSGALRWATPVVDGVTVDLPMPERFREGFPAELIWAPGDRLLLGTAAGALAVFDAGTGRSPGLLATETLLPLEWLALDGPAGRVWAFGRGAGLRSASLAAPLEAVAPGDEDPDDLDD